MEVRLQHQSTAHEPQRAHTNRVRSTPHAGAKLEQTLLMNEGKLGSRSHDAGDSGVSFSLRCGQTPVDDRGPIQCTHSEYQSSHIPETREIHATASPDNCNTHRKL